MTLIDAIGRVLDSVDKPTPVFEIYDMIKSGFLDEEVDSEVSEEILVNCIIENDKLFDYYHGVASIKNQNYKDIVSIKDDISNCVKKHSGNDEHNIAMYFILLHRYAAVQEELKLPLLETSELVSKTFNEPDKVNVTIIKNLIKELIKVYNISVNHQVVDNEINSQLLIALAKVVRIYDWRIHKITPNQLDELFHAITTLKGRLQQPQISKNLSEFLRSITALSIGKEDNTFTTNYSELVPASKFNNHKTPTVHLVPEECNALTFLLHSLVKGYNKIKIDTGLSGYLSNQKSDLIVLIPPFGKLTRTDWEKIFPELDINVGSLEEWYSRTALGSLSEKGKLYLVIPDSLLFDRRASSKNFRNFLIKKNWLESVIKLPRSFSLSNTQINLNLISINKVGSKYCYFCDLSEYELSENTSSEGLIDESINLITKKDEIDSISRRVGNDELQKNNGVLSVNKYINPVHFSDNYVRSASEKIVQLNELVSEIRPPREEVSKKHPFVNMTELSDEPANFELPFDTLPKKKSYSSKQPLLKRDALLLGTIGGALKPTLFNFDGGPIFLGSNVISLKVKNERIDPEYLIAELNSDFVKGQAKNLKKGSTIPHIKKSDLLGIAIRVPSTKKEQVEIFSNWMERIVKEKIQKVKDLHSSIQIIEKEVFNAFAHDFGKILVKVSSNIDTLQGYLENLHRENIINLKDSIFGDSEPESGDRVEEVIGRLRSNFHSAQEFLENEVNRFSDDEVKNNEYVALKDLLTKWKNEQNENGYAIEINVYPENSLAWEMHGYNVPGNEIDLYSVLNNFLDNAIEYGFKDKIKEYKFVVVLEEFDNKYSGQVVMHVGNNGKPFPKDFTCKDFFAMGHSGPDSKGRGIGGYSIKRKLQNMGATIRCGSSLLSNEEYPVQFEITFKENIYE